jgi:hypothetical protein
VCLFRFDEGGFTEQSVGRFADFGFWILDFARETTKAIEIQNHPSQISQRFQCRESWSGEGWGEP